MGVDTTGWGQNVKGKVNDRIWEEAQEQRGLWRKRQIQLVKRPETDTRNRVWWYRREGEKHLSQGTLLGVSVTPRGGCTEEGCRAATESLHLGQTA